MAACGKCEAGCLGSPLKSFSAKIRPRIQELLPLLKKIPALVRRYNLIADHVREAKLQQHRWEISAFPCPRLKSSAKPMDRKFAASHAVKNAQHRSIAE
jgi:hypothetical protein